MTRTSVLVVLVFAIALPRIAAAQPGETTGTQPAAEATGQEETGTPAPGEVEGGTEAGFANPFTELADETDGGEPETPQVVMPQIGSFARPSSAVASGEDEGVPVPSAPLVAEPAPPAPPGTGEGEGPEPAAVAGQAVSPGGAAGTTGESAEDWLDRLAAAPEDAPLLTLRTGPLAISPVGLVQLVGVPWQGGSASIATGNPVDEPGFRFRRARIGFQGSGPAGISFESLSEFTAEGFQLLDLNMTWEVHEAFAMSAGAGKAPFSGAMLTPAMFLAFLDRPWGVDGRTPDGERVGVAPGRMLGMWFSGSWTVLRYRFGVYNGNEDYFLGNDDNGLLYALRLECLPLGDMPDGQLEIADGDPRLRIGAAHYTNDGPAGHTYAAEGDLKFRWLGLTVEGEFLWSRFQLEATPARPPDVAGDVDRWAWYAQAGYLVVPGWLDVSARFDSFWLDDGVDDFNDRWAVAGVATLFLLRNRVKLQAEYAHHHEMAGPQVANDHVALQLQGRF